MREEIKNNTKILDNYKESVRCARTVKFGYNFEGMIVDGVNTLELGQGNAGANKYIELAVLYFSSHIVPESVESWKREVNQSRECPITIDSE